MILSPEAGTVDAALMGVRSQGIAGQGVLATVTFRTVTAGDAKLGLGNVTARDSANKPVVMNGAGNLPPVSLPSVSELRANVPNPFNPSTEFSFVLAQDGSGQLAGLLGARRTRPHAGGPGPGGRAAQPDLERHG
jgi:hypothetical protein